MMITKSKLVNKFKIHKMNLIHRNKKVYIVNKLVNRIMLINYLNIIHKKMQFNNHYKCNRVNLYNLKIVNKILQNYHKIKKVNKFQKNY